MDATSSYKALHVATCCYIGCHGTFLPSSQVEVVEVVANM
jgi:hypothetical protein